MGRNLRQGPRSAPMGTSTGLTRLRLSCSLVFCSIATAAVRKSDRVRSPDATCKNRVRDHVGEDGSSETMCLHMRRRDHWRRRSACCRKSDRAAGHRQEGQGESRSDGKQAQPHQAREAHRPHRMQGGSRAHGDDAHRQLPGAPARAHSHSHPAPACGAGCRRRRSSGGDRRRWLRQ